MLRSNWNENGSVGCNESGYIFSQEKGRAIYVAKEQTDPESLNVSLHVLWQAAKPSRAVDCRPWGLHLQRMCWPLPADHSGGPRGPATGVQSPEQVRQRPWCVSQVTRGWVTSTGTHCATRGLFLAINPSRLPPKANPCSSGSRQKQFPQAALRSKKSSASTCQTDPCWISSGIPMKMFTGPGILDPFPVPIPSCRTLRNAMWLQPLHMGVTWERLNWPNIRAGG